MRFELKILDGKKLFSSQVFETKKDLNLWLAEEKTRTYWTKEFTFEIVDNSKAVDEKRARAKAEFEAAQLDVEKKQAQRQAVAAEIREAIDKKPKTVAEAVALLGKIADYLGI
jgi:hypothetical protein